MTWSTKYIWIIVATCSVLFATEPQWWYNIESSQGVIIGYGVATKYDEARTQAQTEIVRGLVSKVAWKYTAIEKGDLNTYSKEIGTTTEWKSNVFLCETEVIKSERENDNWYVAVSFENLPVEKKISSRLSDTIRSGKSTDSYLRNTILYKNIFLL